MQAVKNSARQKFDSSALSASGGERQQRQQRECTSGMQNIPCAPNAGASGMNDGRAYPLLTHECCRLLGAVCFGLW